MNPTGVVLVLLLAAAPAAGSGEPLPPGTYRLEMRVGAHTAIPLLGATETATVSVSRAVIERNGTRLRQTHQVCSVRFEGGVPIVRLSMPPSFIALLGAPSYPVALRYADDAWRYAADLGVERVGYRPADGGDALPRSAADPRVVDADGDGHPGATLRLTIAGLADGELYVVQRGHSALDGRVVARGHAEGRIAVHFFEQELLGAAPGFLARRPDVRLDPTRSTFRLVRVADGTPCAALDTAPYDAGADVAAEAVR